MAFEIDDNCIIIALFVILVILIIIRLFKIRINFFEQIQTGNAIKNDGILNKAIKIKTQQTMNDFKDTKQIKKRDGEHTKSSVLNEQLTITPDKKDVVEYDEPQEEKQTEEVKKVDELKKVEELKKEIKEVKQQVNEDTQTKEYEQAFKCKNELDYKGNVITDENIYQFNDFSYINANQLHIPTDYKTSEEDYGRNYIPPELWYKNNQRLNLPICVPANGRCTVKENLTTGYPVDLVEWHESRKVMNPDGINVKYINEKLNTNSDIV